MTSRLYFLVPDEQAATKVVTALGQQGIDKDAIHAVAHRERYPLAEEIPEAGITERSDVKHAAVRGAATGGGLGLFAGLAAVAVNPIGLVAAGGAVAAAGLLGSGFGAWASSLIGVSVTNTDFDEFEKAIDEGKILMLVDVEDDQKELVCNAITTAYDKVVIESGEVGE